MTQTVATNTETQPIGFAPILGYYFEKCGISQIIDEQVPLDPRRKVLTHGQASIAMITGILFQVLQLYRLCKFADETTVLDVILPGVAPQEYFDDRLADTLDQLYAHGIGNLETTITKRMIEEFQIQNEVCHNDTTSASFYGQADNNKTDKSIKITFGYSKKHRQDLKLRIPEQTGHPFRSKAATHSDRKWPPNPVETGHPFRSKPATLWHCEIPIN